ncbi:MAG: chemotaxis protein CheR [Desulfuromonas sp.]|nr:MAG: chemotaxis protein CheR [Desulfuromonas sp.]
MKDQETDKSVAEQPAKPLVRDLTGLRISDKDFSRFAALIYEQCGIKMPLHKRSMLEARLRKRLRTLGLDSYEAYREYLFSSDGMVEELTNMIDVVTTNKTDFFREPRHFDYMIGTSVPALIAKSGAGIERPLRIWSAGCSSGEEPYTIAMFLESFLWNSKKIDYQILATDISTQVLEKAILGIYHRDKIEPVPDDFRKKYLLKSKNPESRQVRIVPALREKLKFCRVNFMDSSFEVGEAKDIIFCRNVIIYFDRATQERFLHRLCQCLRSGGYLYMGHSETLSGMPLPLNQLAPAIYQKK